MADKPHPFCCPVCDDDRVVPCDECGGRGRIRHDCHECGGDGYLDWEEREECGPCEGRGVVTSDCAECDESGELECVECPRPRVVVTDPYTLEMMNTDRRFSHAAAGRVADVKSVIRDNERIELFFKADQVSWWVDWHDVRLWNALDRLAAI